MRTRTRHRIAAAACAVATCALGVAAQSPAQDRAELQSTDLISRSTSGGIPNGPSTNAVISGDRRYSRLIAFESEASDLIAGDTNGLKDVFVVVRGGRYSNVGEEWRPGSTRLVSRGLGGAPANGPSWGAAVDGDFDHGQANCVAFLSSASNLVRGDTNGRVDAFLVKRPGGSPVRVSLPGNRQSREDATAVDVSGDCRKTAFVIGGRLYVRGSKTLKLRHAKPAADPYFAEGRTSDIVFGAPGGVYLAREGRYRPSLVAPGGSNPAFNNIKRQVVAYERPVGGGTQVVFKDLGRDERVASARSGRVGNDDSHHPVIGNSGYYISFESNADNLGTTSTGRLYDDNDAPDVYLYTDVRKITLAQSVFEKGVPVNGGGRRPSMSFYANYIVFHANAPLGSRRGTPQIWMRYLGPV
ncbi:MAG: hypothetical protein M3340_15425 [Actinomycetota bacterium]|nr:hypothetical protein [Actinomycetota bacterium]